MTHESIPFVDLHAQYLCLKNEIDSAIASVISDSSFIRGKHVENFENNFAKLLGIKHCVSCANGTDAIYIAMKGLGIKPGDEVITTAHSWISTSETITQAGGRVIFCDTDGKTFTINSGQIESKITSRTVGIIPVHLYGQAADMDPILAVAKKHKLWVVEDCAQAHLAKYKGKLVGSFGNAATFSFYPGKNLGAMGDAGAIVTNDSKLAEWCTLYARHGGKGEHFIEGINSRMDGVQAAILNAKLPYLNGWTTRRCEIADRYDHFLKSVKGIEIPYRDAGREHVFHLYVLKTKNRDALRNKMFKDGIGTSINYPRALPYYPAYGYMNHAPLDFPHAYSDQSQIISIPIYPEMSDAQVQAVAESVRSFSEL